MVITFFATNHENCSMITQCFLVWTVSLSQRIMDLHRDAIIDPYGTLVTYSAANRNC